MKSAIDLIESKLTDKVDVEEIAKQAYSSSYHFQRMFHLHTGVTIGEYIRKRRLTLAAQDLAMSSVKVMDISLKYGYESPESFAKAFRKVHGISPSEARMQGVVLKAFPRISLYFSLRGDRDIDYQIVNRDEFQVTGKTIRVSLEDGEDMRLIPQFWHACESDGTVERLRALHLDRILLGICTTDYQREELTYAIAAESDVPTTDKEQVSLHIPASTWAVFTSTGALPSTIQGVWRRIFEEWFPATSYQHTGGPELEVYLPGDPRSDDYKCEVWIPVKIKKQWITD
ncbi:AraC family transcriptional regulator [Paenibacillus sp. Soil787]|nr:AraC family transcriptional regulator [Paenibacillus sp. Soil787]